MNNEQWIKSENRKANAFLCVIGFFLFLTGFVVGLAIISL